MTSTAYAVLLTLMVVVSCPHSYEHCLRTESCVTHIMGSPGIAPAVLRWQHHLEATKGPLSHRCLGLYRAMSVGALQFPAPLIVTVTDAMDVSRRSVATACTYLHSFQNTWL